MINKFVRVLKLFKHLSFNIFSFFSYFKLNVSETANSDNSNNLANKIETEEILDDVKNGNNSEVSELQVVTKPGDGVNELEDFLATPSSGTYTLTSSMAILSYLDLNCDSSVVKTIIIPSNYILYIGGYINMGAGYSLIFKGPTSGTLGGTIEVDDPYKETFFLSGSGEIKFL
ncbi:MAG: hypothetical protein L6U99_01020 [Clostridium sp.]|nr:MAG: hypothetical protein L6U99_01020 [Clostridium sp.]